MKIQFQSPLKVQECTQRLEQVLKSQPPPTLFPRYSPPYPVRGRVRENWFVLSIPRWRRGNFYAFYGRLQSQPLGSRIEIDYRISTFSKVFWGIWFGTGIITPCGLGIFASAFMALFWVMVLSADVSASELAQIQETLLPVTMLPPVMALIFPIIWVMIGSLVLLIGIAIHKSQYEAQDKVQIFELITDTLEAERIRPAQEQT